jgi:hypothetical protein
MAQASILNDTEIRRVFRIIETPDGLPGDVGITLKWA